MKAKGNCFDVHGHIFCGESLGDDWRIVHGIVLNAIDDLPMVHCWLERTDTFMSRKGSYERTYCIDKSNGHDVELPKDMYYEAGRVQKTVKYKQKEYWRRLCEHNNYGPWELECER